MKNKNALATRNAPGLPDLKRMGNILRITSRILAAPVAPDHNRTDEQGRKQGRWTESVDGDVYEGTYVNGKAHGQWVLLKPDGTEARENWRHGKIVE